MRVFIRQSVFETNSSSSHATNIDPAEAIEIDVLRLNLRNGEVPVELRYFGSEHMRYRKFSNKLAYLVSQVACQVFRQESPKLGSDVTSAITANRFGKQIADVVRKVTGCDLRVMTPQYDFSIGSPRTSDGDSAFASPEAMKSFLFSDASYIQTGYDNSYEGIRIRTDDGFDELFYVDHFVSEAEGDADFVLVANADLNEFGLRSANLEIDAHIEDNLLRHELITAFDGITATSIKVVGANKPEYRDDDEFAQRMAHVSLAGMRLWHRASTFNLLENAPFTAEGDTLEAYPEVGRIEFACVASPELVADLEQKFLDLCSFKNGMAR